MKPIKKVGIILLIVITILASLMFLIVHGGYTMYKEALEEIPLEEKIQTIRQKGNYTKIEEIPQIYKDAVISVEDHRFYNHVGIDPIAILRAMITDIKEWKLAQGGSTITQQLAKNMYFTQDKKIKRKIAEIFMAFDLEKNLKKDEILELYINTSYYGNGYYTPKEASIKYFNKEFSKLSDYEYIMLAGIPNAPSAYNPLANLELAKQRQKQVIDKMIKNGKLTQEEADNILKNENLNK